MWLRFIPHTAMQHHEYPSSARLKHCGGFVGEVGEITLVGDSAPGVVRIIPGIFPEKSLFSR